MSKPVIVLGGGGHARVLIDALVKNGVTVLGVTEINFDPANPVIRGIPVIGDDGAVLAYSAAQVCLVNGMGSTGDPNKRKHLFESFKKRGYSFLSVIHPAAVIASEVTLGEGVQIMAGAVVQTGSRIGCNTIINTGASVDHDCIIGDHAHIAPGVTLSGGVRIGAGAHIGTGATAVHGVSIGEDSVVGAGSVVIDDLPPGVTAYGVPARVVK